MWCARSCISFCALQFLSLLAPLVQLAGVFWRASPVHAVLLGLGQAKKEELWELSKREGELADSTADVHYAEHVARAPPPRTAPSIFAARQL